MVAWAETGAGSRGLRKGEYVRWGEKAEEEADEGPLSVDMATRGSWRMRGGATEMRLRLYWVVSEWCVYTGVDEWREWEATWWGE